MSLVSAPALEGQAQGATDPAIAAVGDMACAPTNLAYNAGNGNGGECRQRYVSDLLINPAPTALLDLGDNQYDNGELANYQTVYHPTFGRVNPVVYPSLGNAEYDTVGAQGFFDYFSSVGVTSRIASSGADASHFSDGYYSFDIGSWHMIALNSNCQDIGGGCKAGNPQELWLKADLAAHPNRCTLAYWHHPRWNSGSLGNDSSTAPFWTDLYNARADIVLNGHGNHHYERFVPQTPAGAPDLTNGVREFIVSTGGESHGTPPGTPGDPATSQVTDYTSFGVLRLTLHAAGYDWQFVPEVGGSFTDSGSGVCHSVAAQKPSPPSLSATAGDSTVRLSWSTPSDGGVPIRNYKVYRGTDAGGETLLSTLGNVALYDDNAAVNGTKYFYRVAAVNSAGEGAQSNEVSATPTASPLPAPFPHTPVLDDFARPAGGLGSNWQSPGLADPGTVAIQSSGLTANGSGAGSATWSSATFAADQEAYLIVPTLPRAGSFIQVAGRVSNLSSGLSCYFLRVTPSTGTWDLRKKLNGAGSTSIKTFSAPFGAGDGLGLQLIGSTITAYRKAGAAAWASVGSASDTAIPGVGYSSFTLGDTTIRAGAFGGGSLVTAPSPQRPSAPALSAAAGDSTVRLTWSAPADGGAAITSYNVYRGTAAGGETLLTTLGNLTTYDDSTAVNGTTYYYRVAAVNSVGEGTQSNEVAGMPAGSPPPPLPFPRTALLDSFARPAAPLGTNWQSPGLADPGTVAILTGGATASSSGAGSATWSVTAFAPNQEAYLIVPALPRTGAFMQVAGRVSNLSSSSLSCYFLRVTPSTSTWDLRKKLNGAGSTSLKTFSAPFAPGDSLGLQLVGSTLTAYREPGAGAWTSVGSTTDTAISAGGYLSFTLGDMTIRGGAFGGGSIVN